MKELDKIENNKLLKELHDNIYGENTIDINDANIYKSEEPLKVQQKPSNEKMNYLSNLINKLKSHPNKINSSIKSNDNRSNETLNAKALLNKSKALSKKLKKLK